MKGTRAFRKRPFIPLTKFFFLFSQPVHGEKKAFVAVTLSTRELCDLVLTPSRHCALRSQNAEAQQLLHDALGEALLGDVLDHLNELLLLARQESTHRGALLISLCRYGHSGSQQTSPNRQGAIPPASTSGQVSHDQPITLETAASQICSLEPKCGRAEHPRCCRSTLQVLPLGVEIHCIFIDVNPNFHRLQIHFTSPRFVSVSICFVNPSRMLFASFRSPMYLSWNLIAFKFLAMFLNW